MSDVVFKRSGSTVVATVVFQAPAERVWEVFSDPRKLERWWGPPTWPATFSRYEFQPGGEVRYHMTGPDGSEAHGWWRINVVSFPRLEFIDGFSDAEGMPDLSMPTNNTKVELIDEGDTTTVVFTSQYDSEDSLLQVLEMGMEEGFTLAVGQIPSLLEV
ncbi:SRPBCC family protein [Timonella sp. A28]|uniref:SRPBCC family protein n=1 Tax=Timonella sp. A28 TaxID=3442640 RepID=UPI003EBE2A95